MLGIRWVEEGGELPRGYGVLCADYLRNGVYVAPLGLNRLYRAVWGAWLWLGRDLRTQWFDREFLRVRWAGYHEGAAQAERRLNRYWHNRYCTDLTEQLYLDRKADAPSISSP